MTLKPLRNNVVLLPSDTHQESKLGIIVAANVSNQGVVKALGPECKELKLGDVVRYDVESSRKLDSYVMCREQDVLCVIE